MASYLIALISNDQTEEEGAWNGLLAITAKSHIVVKNFNVFYVFFSRKHLIRNSCIPALIIYLGLGGSLDF